MGIFSRNYDRPGPGVAPNAPRKKGIARWWEVFSRDGWSFFRAGLLVFVGAIPYLAGLALAVFSRSLLILLIACILGGMIAGPEFAGLNDTILRALRDEPGYWWTTYRRIWKRDWKLMLLPGALTGLIFGVQLFMLCIPELLSSLSSVMLVLFFVGILLAVGLIGWLWPQLSLLTLSFGGMLRNMVMLFIAYLPRSLGAMGVQVAYWALIYLFYPYTSLLLPLTGVWFPLSISLLILYKPLDKAFSVEENVHKLHENDLQG